MRYHIPISPLQELHILCNFHVGLLSLVKHATSSGPIGKSETGSSSLISSISDDYKREFLNDESL